MGPQPQGQYPGYVPVYQPVRRPLIDSVRTLVSDLMLAIAVVVGLLFLMLGWLILGLTGSSGVMDFGQVLRALGLFVLTVAMLLAGLIRVDMDKWVRVSLIIGTVLLITWEGFWVIIY